MTGSVALLFALPSTRRFYALGLPPSRALVSAAVISAIAYAALEGWWIIDQRSRPPDERIRRVTHRGRAGDGLQPAESSA